MSIHADAMKEMSTPERRKRVLLIGRPNSGKSSLFNAVTGGQAKVGNFPGITVDLLEHSQPLPNGGAMTLVDLPGAYTLEAMLDKDTDEAIAREQLDIFRKDPCGIVVQVIDATQLALGLKLTQQLRELPLVVVLTQADLLERSGQGIDVERLQKELGVPVILTSARDPKTKDVFLRAVSLHQNERLAHSNFSPVELAQAVTRATHGYGASAPSERLDALLLHPLLGPFLFLGLMAVLFACIFLVADPAKVVIDRMMEIAGSFITKTLGRGWLTSLLVSGILGGAGTVLAFAPQIVLLTIFMEILDASGYLARGSFLLDRILRGAGLSGRSFLPLLMGHACAVPAISSTRIIRDPKERLVTILVLPLMTCSARLPTYSLLLTTFVEGAFRRAVLFVFLYAAGIITGLIASVILRRTAVKGRSLPLVIELPRYRFPQMSVIRSRAISTLRRFLKDVGTTIVVASAVLWLALHIPVSKESPERQTVAERSLAASVGRIVEPVTKHAGFDWRINVALIGSFGARELMVSTLGVIMGVENVEQNMMPLSDSLRLAKTATGAPRYTLATAVALLGFFVIACQCMSTVSAVRRETKSLRWPAFVLGYTYAAGFAVAVVGYKLAKLLL